MRHSYQVVGFVLLAATVGVTALGRWSVPVATAWTVTMTAAILMAAALRTGDGEVAMRAAAAPAVAVLPLAFLTLLQLSETRFADSLGVGCGGLLPPHVFAIGLAAAGGVVASRAPTLVSSRIATRGGLVLAIAATFVVVAGVTIARRSAAARFPTANAWVNTLPVVARFAPAQAEREVECGGGVCVERVCKQGEVRCFVSLVGARRGAIPDNKIDDFHARVSRENVIEVRRGEGGPVFVRELTRWRDPPSAFDARSGERIAFRLGAVKTHVAAPPGWIRGGFLGLAVAVVCALWGLVRRKMPRDGWRPAMHHGCGMLRTFEREGRFEAAAGLPLGPVFARSPDEAGSAYRDGPSTPITHVIRAVGVDLDRSLTTLDIAPFVLALGALLALAAPVLVASLYGLA